MNTHDPIFESLDRLAGIADADHVGDRMPDIKRRVRVARRRKGAGLAVAVALIAVAGVGVSQGLPTTRTAPPPANPSAEHWQEIAVDAQPYGPGYLRISFTVTGQSSAYTDIRTDKPSDYAGPLLTDAKVDGESIATTEERDLVCRPGGESTSYSRKFRVNEPIVVPVSGGKHTVTVSAAHCADGELTEATTRVVVTAEAGGFTTGDQRKTDLDGDGVKDKVWLLVPDDVERDLELRVDWGTGETSAAKLPNTMETGLRDPIDLDGDGDLELITQGGGGDTSVTKVFQAGPISLDEVETVDAADTGASLATSAEPTTWQVHVAADGIYSYRLTDPTTLDFPAPVTLRRWNLEGNTLTLPEQSETQCVSFQPVFELGPC